MHSADIEDYSRLLAPLKDRRDKIADAWYEAVAHTGFTPLTEDEVRRRLGGLTDRLISALTSERFERREGQQIGTDLTDLHYLSENTLGRTLEVLPNKLAGSVSAEEFTMLQPRISVLLSEIATGFVKHARLKILEEQEQVQTALMRDRLIVEGALRKSEASLAEAQRIAHLGHWEYDMTQDELRWSEEVYRIFGLSDEQENFTPTLQAFQKAVHPDDNRHVEQMVAEAFKGQPVVFEHRIVRPDGEERMIQQRADFVFDHSGRPLGLLVGTVQDITERKQIEEELKRRARQLEFSNAELERFASTIAHDLQAPVRRTGGFARILLEDYADSLDEEGVDYLRRMKECCDYTGELIDGILDLSRIARTRMSHESVELSAMAADIARSLRESEPGREIEFIVAEGLVAEGDPMLLWTALQNLLNNAWKFTQDEPYPRIEFGAKRQQDGKTAYFVRDNGMGFDPADAEKVFGVFQRLEQAEEIEGSGIGLATVERVIERHGGRVWAEASLGTGATFYFTLD